MPNVRAKNKRLLGGQVDESMFVALDEWRRKNPRKSNTDFLIEACVAKLDKEGITYNRDAVLADARPRRLGSPPDARHAASSSVDISGKRALKKAGASVRRPVLK
jgi:hypothetical protein